MSEDDFQSDPRPEAGIFHNQTARNSGPEEGHDTSTSTFSFLGNEPQNFAWILLKNESRGRKVILFWYASEHFRFPDMWPYC